MTPPPSLVVTLGVPKQKRSPVHRRGGDTQDLILTSPVPRGDGGGRRRQLLQTANKSKR